MAIEKKKVIDLLAASISPTTIAQTLGCDPSYIVQLASDPEILEAVVAIRVAKATKIAATDDKVQDIRSVLIDQMGKVAQFTTKMSDICMALNTIDKMASRLPSANTREESATKSVVNLTLPKEMAIHFVMNAQNQIVEVNDRALETMSANRVLGELQQKIAPALEFAGNGKTAENAAQPRQLTAADF